MKKRGEGRERLIEAARLEFEEHGFDGTNTNAIAKRADYAPQTFYRHFEDKLAIFLAVYEAWVASEAGALAKARTAEAITDQLIKYHRTHRVFRRSLRALTVTEPQVGAARAQARLAQMELMMRFTGKREPAWLLAELLTMERVCDAIVEGEFEKCGVSRAKARAELVRIVREMMAGR